MSATAAWTGDRFAHEAFVFDRDAQALDRVVPFVDEGLRRGEPVIVVVAATTAAIVRTALGSDVDRLELFAESEAWWRGDAYRTLAAYADVMAPLQAAGQPWRLVGEPVWLAYDRGHHWSRLESACNESFAEVPYYSLCLHDRRRLDASTLEHVARTHPTTWRGGGVVPEPAYESPVDYLRSVEPAWTEPAAREHVADVTSPAAARRLVASAAVVTVDPDAVVLTASELASNALVAAPACRVSTWVDGSYLVVEVADHGPGFDAGLAGYVPPSSDALAGRGLWMVRHLAADLGLRSDGTGTFARARFPLADRR